jgi:ABC-type polar amino acid transport system ATPase subunit
MLKTLQLKDIFVGKTDAKNEFIENTKDEQNKFIDSYLIPENIILSDFEKGKKYYITGLKGTGKTALLRFLELKFKLKNANSSFILFKSEFSEEDKTNFSKAASTFLTEKNETNEIEEDFLNIWEWFLHRHIVKYSKEYNISFFQNNKDWDKYSKCVLAPKL